MVVRNQKLTIAGYGLVACMVLIVPLILLLAVNATHGDQWTQRSHERLAQILAHGKIEWEGTQTEDLNVDQRAVKATAAGDYGLLMIPRDYPVKLNTGTFWWTRDDVNVERHHWKYAAYYYHNGTDWRLIHDPVFDPAQ